jgi:hypothetical protein
MSFALISRKSEPQPGPPQSKNSSNELRISEPNDALEQEADRIADHVTQSDRMLAWSSSKLSARQVQRQSTPIPPGNQPTPAPQQMDPSAALGKLAEAFLQTDVGRKLIDAVKQDQLVKGALGFVETLPGKVVAGAAAVGAVTGLAASHKSLPAQIPEIPLDAVKPGLKVKIDYEGSVNRPTQATITFSYTPQIGKRDKPKETDSERYRAETARIAAEQEKFRAGLKYSEGSPQDLEQKQQQKIFDQYTMSKLMQIPGVPGASITTPQAPGGTTPGTGLRPPTFQDPFAPKTPKLLDQQLELKPLSPEPDAEKKKEEPATPLQRKAANGAPGNAVLTAANVLPRSAGSPLDESTRRFMESRFGFDFSRVRVHADQEAAASARSVNALAYTVDGDLVFGAGQYSPGTLIGTKLLAHELAHTIQQGGAAAKSGHGVSGSHQPSIAPARTLQRKCACGGSEECEECKRGKIVQRKVSGGLESPLAAGLVIEALQSRGCPLDSDARSFYEPKFGHDLSQVRVHADSKAAASARAVAARAYTVGSDIVFAAGEFENPRARSKLLSHELSHVIQQSGGAILPSGTTLRAYGPSIARKSTSEQKAKVTTDPVIEIRIDIGQNLGLLQTQSGLVLTGGAVTDLSPGEYRATPDPKHQKWIIAGVEPGLRFWLELDPLDKDSDAPGPNPWALSYASEVKIFVGGGDVAPPSTASLDARISDIRGILEQTYVSSTDELRLISLISDAPEEQATEFIKRLTDEQVNGKSFLDELDHRVDGENNQRLHEALSLLRLKSIGPEKSLPALTEAPILPWHDVMGPFEDSATFEVTKTDKGKYRLRYLGGTRLLGASDFGAEIHKLPADLFIGGLDFDPGSTIIVHDYDSGHFVPLVVDELAGYEHAGIRKFISDVANVASLATPVSAARTVAGKAAVYTMERVLPALILLADENRLNLIRWFPKWGPRMLKFADIAKAGVALYGMGRFAISSAQFFKNWKQVRGSRSLLDGATTSEEAEKLATQLEKQADEIIAEAEKLQKAEAGAKPPSAEATKTTAAGPEGTLPLPGTPETPKPLAPRQPASRVGVVAKPSAKAPIKFDPLDGVTDETRTLLQSDANQALKNSLETNPHAAQALKRCLSPCYPIFAKPEQIARIEKILSEGEEHGFSINYARLRERLRDPSIKTAEDLDKAIEGLSGALEEQKNLAELIALHDRLAPPGEYYDQTPLAKALRRRPGAAHGGENLATQGQNWLQEEKAGLFPKQIADKMRDRPFSNFDEFRETFWKLVDNDPELSAGWSSSNRTLMRSGRAPFVSQAERIGGGSNAVWQVDHKLAIKNNGGVYDLDNLQIVSPKFHVQAGEN